MDLETDRQREPYSAFDACLFRCSYYSYGQLLQSGHQKFVVKLSRKLQFRVGPDAEGTGRQEEEMMNQLKEQIH